MDVTVAPERAIAVAVSNILTLAVAVNVVELPAQMVAPEAVGAAGVGRTVTVTAVLGPLQPLTVV